MNNSATILNLASMIEHHARLTPDKEAIVWNKVRLTYSASFSGSLTKSRMRSSRWALGSAIKWRLVCPNLPYFPIVYYGILKAGAAVVPLNVLFKQREIAYHLTDSDAKAIFVFEGTDELPMAQMVKAGFDEVESCEHLIVMMKHPESQSPFSEHKTLHEITAMDKAMNFRDLSDRA